jgi:hypothetical protein
MCNSLIRIHYRGKGNLYRCTAISMRISFLARTAKQVTEPCPRPAGDGIAPRNCAADRCIKDRYACNQCVMSRIWSIVISIHLSS